MLHKIKTLLVGKHVRYFTVHLDLLPGGWVAKPRLYRFDHKRFKSDSREGDFYWLFFGASWSRNPVD